MGLGTNHTTTTVADKWIPEEWQDKAIASYMATTVMRNHVMVEKHAKNRGDVIHYPAPNRGEASAKAANTQVNFIADTANEILVSINKHFEYSKFYENIADILALNGMQRFYTSDAGYALARKVDGELHKIMATMQGGSIAGATNLFEKAVIGGDGTTNFSGATNGNGTALTDAGLRAAIQLLEDSDVNSAECVLVVPPTVIKTLRGIARFTEQAFVGNGDTIKTGRVGNLYGIEVFSSSLCPWIHVNSVTGTQSVRIWKDVAATNTAPSAAPTGAAFVDDFGLTVDWATSSPTDTKYRACALLHPDSIILAEAQGITTRQQEKIEYLGYAVVSDTIFGCAEMRDYGAVSIIVPA
jgi:hypothetical protein